MRNVDWSVVGVPFELTEEGSAVGVKDLDDARFSTCDEEFTILTEGAGIGLVFESGDSSFDCASGSIVDYDLLVVVFWGKERGCVCMCE